MENLQTEILQHIFELLPLEDHIQCIRTCHLWKSIIEEVYLFQTMTIYSERLNVFSKKATECKRRLGRRIEHVQLYLCYFHGEINIANHLQQFPNIRKITCIGLNAANPSFNEVPSWHRSVESIFEFDIPGLVHSLLSISVCPNLTELTTSMEENITPLLKNAPNLKSLSLRVPFLTFERLNQIHENTPNLKSLSLWNTYLEEKPFGNRIIPAHSVSEFKWVHYNYLRPEMLLRFLQFIILKCPNLVKFEYDDTYGVEDTEEVRNNLFELGYNPLIKTLAPHLKKLHLNHAGLHQKFLDAFDTHNCQIHDLKLHSLNNYTFPTFEQSNQTQYIRSLSLHEVRITSFKWLREFKVLENLDIKINWYNKPVSLDFNEIIDNASPTLTSLRLTRIELRSKLNSARETNIESLTLNCCRLPHEIGMFIDRHFPLLSKLEFKNCRHTTKKLILRSISLDSFLITDQSNEKAINILVHTTLNNNDRWYSTREKVFYKPFFMDTDYDMDYPPVKSQPAEDLTVKPDFYLACYRINKILLCRQ